MSSQYDGLISKWSGVFGVPFALIKAIIEQESSFNSNAARYEPALRDSSIGLMQLLTSTASRLAGHPVSIAELKDPDLNIQLGAKYLAEQLSRYGGRLKDAIAAYNAGTARKNQAGVYVNSKGVPNVQKYVDSVWSRYLKFVSSGGLALPSIIPLPAVLSGINPLYVYGAVAIAFLLAMLWLKGDEKGNGH